MVLDGDIDENNCVDDFKEAVNLVGKSVVLDGDIDENNSVDDFEDTVNLVEKRVVLDGDIEENECIDDFETEEDAYVVVFGRIVGDNAI